MHSLVRRVAFHTAANTSTECWAIWGKAAFLFFSHAADLYKNRNMSQVWRDWSMTFFWILLPAQSSLCFFLGSRQGREDPLEGMSRWGEQAQGRESIAICLSHLLNCSNLPKWPPLRSVKKYKNCIHLRFTQQFHSAADAVQLVFAMALEADSFLLIQTHQGFRILL